MMEEHGNNITVQRKSNIELCRIICMILIIAHHCVVHGGAINMEICNNKFLALLFLPAGKLCFDAFLAISTWFIVDKNFKSEKFLKIWGQVWFYSILFTMITAIIAHNIQPRNWFSVLFPITGNSHGFAAAYLAFYLLLPFLSMISEKISKIQLKWLISLLFYFQVISKIIGTIGEYNAPICSNELTLFVLFYFTSLYLKKYSTKIMHKKRSYITIIICIWIFIVTIWWLHLVISPENQFISVVIQLCSDESSIIYIFGGYAFFFLFYNIKIPVIPIINKMAQTTFGILLIHDHNFFRYPLWNLIFKCNQWYYDQFFLIHILVCVYLIFIIGASIDIIRQICIEKTIFSCKKIKTITNRIDNLIKGDKG